MLSLWWGNLAESCDARLLTGVGTYVCWLLLLAMSPVFSSMPTLMVQGVSWRMASLVVATVLFAAALVVSIVRGAAQGSPGVTLVAAAGLAAFLGVLAHRYAEGAVVEAFSPLCVGFGIAVFCLAWAKPFIEVKLRKRVAGTAAGSIAGCLLYLVVAAVPQPFALFVGACLPMVSAACWIMLRTAPAIGEDGSTASAPSHPAADVQPGAASSSGPLFGRHLSLAVGLYGMLFVLAGHVLPEVEASWVSSVVPGVVNVAAFLLVEVVLSAYMVKRVHRENPVVAYRPAAILVAVAFLLLPFSGMEAAIVCMAVAFGGFGSFMVFLWIVMGNICQKQGQGPVRVYSQGFLTLTAGMLLGEATAAALVLSRQSGFDYVATLCVIALFLLVLMSWQMSDGSQMASETKEMGGAFFDRGPDESAEAADLDAVVERYRLSPREAEVLALLVKGRSIPYICDELFVAKSTVQTHVRHIYAKMEITEGRQELIDRVEGRERAPK